MDNLTPAVPDCIAQLATAFSHPQPIRRGSLYERRMKCGPLDLIVKRPGIIEHNR
jgi:hypothetical protein